MTFWESCKRAERGLLRWCRVRGHSVDLCRVADSANRPLGSLASVYVLDIQGYPGVWAVAVWSGASQARLHITGTYAEAWALGADLARALERRGADGRRL